MNKLKTMFVVIFLMMSVSVVAQRERNYIYLLDCTKSMIGYGNNPSIWQPTKNYLKKDIDKQPKGTELHIIPFQGRVLPSFDFEAGQQNWNDIEEKLDEHVKKVTNTNICAAWDAIDSHLNNHKDNYVILLTDGHDNVQGMEAVLNKLRNWCGKYPNTYAFYVLLTEAAIDNRVIDVINLCDNEFVVNATKGIPIFGSVDKTIIYANTLNLQKKHQIGFSSAGEYTVKAICEDSYFDVSIVDNKIKNGSLQVQIFNKKDIAEINGSIPQTYEFTFEVCSKDVDITNPVVTVNMTNKPERSLEILSEESDLGKATWHDGFLFWGASDPDTLSIDLKALFNEEAQKDNSSVEFIIADPDGGKNFQLFYNGQAVKDGKVTLDKKSNANSKLSVVFNPDAKEGTRYLIVKSKNKQQLDKINDEPVEQYNLSLRSKYVVNWNPLKTILMWLLIFIVAALLIWFLLIRRFIYPTINVKTIQINDPYFSKVNVKGKRRVVFTNKTMKQSLLNRIFTGEILYKKDEIWTSPLTFEAGAKRKTIRVVRTKDYVFDPFTSLLKTQNDYVVENVNDKTKIKLSVN